MRSSLSGGLGTLAVVLGVGYLLLVSAIRRDKLPRNPLIGIRLPPLLASDEAWVAGHRAACGPLRQLSPAGIALGIGAFLLTDPAGEIVGTVAVGIQFLALGMAVAAALRAV